MVGTFEKPEIQVYEYIYTGFHRFSTYFSYLSLKSHFLCHINSVQFSLKFIFHAMIVFHKDIQIFFLLYCISHKDKYEARTKPHWNADAGKPSKPIAS